MKDLVGRYLFLNDFVIIFRKVKFWGGTDMGQFNVIHHRKNTRSIKWDMLKSVFNQENVIPMWIADMDFKSPDAINEAIIERAKHGIYGYTTIDDELKQTIKQWLKRRHNWEIQADWLSFSPGVVTSLYIAIQAFTEPKDKILIQTPVYTPFFNMIEQHERVIVENPLIKQNNYYKIDFADFEEKLKQGVKAFIFCSPHNPVGRVWTKEELEKIGRLCVKYDVLILSDDIHADLVFPGHKHIPIASLSEKIAYQTMTFMSPTKTFNIAGLQASYAIINDQKRRKKFEDFAKKQGFHSLNTMGNIALEAAYKYGDKWLDELIEVLNSHKKYVIDTFKEHIPKIRVVDAEGTYLLWIDFSQLGLDADELQKFLIKKAKVGLNPGIDYGNAGEQFMRMNIACPRQILEQAVNQIIEAVKYNI